MSAVAVGRMRRRPRRIVAQVPKWAVVAVILIFYLVPLAYLLNTALKSQAEFTRSPIGLVEQPDLGNFVTAWVRGDFAAYILNSVLYAICAAGLATLVSFLLAFPVARGYLGGTRWWNIGFALLLFLPNAIITQFQLLLRLGLYNTQLGYILILAAAVGVGPILLRGYMTSIPTELDEAAALDGIGYWRYLWTFVLPLAKPAIVTVFILQVIGVWNEIILATILLVDESKLPISKGLYNFQGTYTSEYSLLAAATLIVAAPLVIAYVFLQRYLVNGLAGGAVKG